MVADVSDEFLIIIFSPLQAIRSFSCWLLVVVANPNALAVVMMFACLSDWLYLFVLSFTCSCLSMCMCGLQRSGINSSDVEVLTLPNVTEDDAGEYICKVSNYIGEVSESGWLTVIPGNH